MPVNTEPLNPGSLRHQITWRRKTAIERNAFGEEQIQWQDVALVKAEVVPISGREMEALAQRWAEAQYRIRQHYVAGMEPTHRGEWQVDGVSHFLDILGVQNDGGMGRSQTIFAKEWLP